MVKTRSFGKMILIDSPWINYDSALLARLAHMMPRRAFMYNVSFDHRFRKSPFEKISQSFLDDPKLHFSKVLPAETIEMVFREHKSLFGGQIFQYRLRRLGVPFANALRQENPLLLHGVGRIAAFCFAAGEDLPDSDTGNYCRVRARLSIDALHELVVLVAKNTETLAPSDWLLKDRYHAKLVGGFTATMSDTAKNRAKYPQHEKQAEGRGFPIVRACVVLSLAMAMVVDATFAEYKGKENGESALLRKMLSTLPCPLKTSSNAFSEPPSSNLVHSRNPLGGIRRNSDKSSDWHPNHKSKSSKESRACTARSGHATPYGTKGYTPSRHLPRSVRAATSAHVRQSFRAIVRVSFFQRCVLPALWRSGSDRDRPSTPSASKVAGRPRRIHPFRHEPLKKCQG